MPLQIILRVAMQEGDIAAIMGTPTKQQLIKNKTATLHHFQ
jgi:hypothetical protein